jgi:hypothetical protein
MFASAFEKATKFTRPLVICLRHMDGSCSSGMGTFVLLNADGWAVTAHHIIAEFGKFQQQIGLAKIHRAALDAVAAEPDPNKRRAKSRRLPNNDKLVEEFAVWFGQDDVNVEDGSLREYPFADIALVRLTGLDFPADMEFPTFKRDGSLRPGTSLIKVGYPFHTVEPKYLSDENRFWFDDTTMRPIPIDGIFTRLTPLVLPPHVAVEPPGLPMQRLESSSPGLRGQSGGPTLDMAGNVWGIQSSTVHLDLGFSPSKRDDRNRDIVEHQFLNVGWGIPPGTLEHVFQHAGVQVSWTD